MTNFVQKDMKLRVEGNWVEVYVSIIEEGTVYIGPLPICKKDVAKVVKAMFQEEFEKALKEEWNIGKDFKIEKVVYIYQGAQVQVKANDLKEENTFF